MVAIWRMKITRKYSVRMSPIGWHWFQVLHALLQKWCSTFGEKKRWSWRGNSKLLNERKVKLQLIEEEIWLKEENWEIGELDDVLQLYFLNKSWRLGQRRRSCWTLELEISSDVTYPIVLQDEPHGRLLQLTADGRPIPECVWGPGSGTCHDPPHRHLSWSQQPLISCLIHRYNQHHHPLQSAARHSLTPPTPRDKSTNNSLHTSHVVILLNATHCSKCVV